MTKYLLTAWCGHDAAATLIRDGEIAYSITQERLDRIKHSDGTGRSVPDDGSNPIGGFPWLAVNYCIKAEGIKASDVDVFSTNFQGVLPNIGREFVPFPGHHLCHAAAAHYCSGFARSCILVVDYVGDTTSFDTGEFIGYERQSAWVGSNEKIEPVWKHLGTKGATLFGIGCIYNQVSAYLFPHGDSEGKLMALAALGQQSNDIGGPLFEFNDGQIFVKPCRLFVEKRDRPDFLPEDAPHFECDLDWDSLPPSPAEQGEFSSFHKDLAYRIQVDFEDAMLYWARNLVFVTGSNKLCLSGGCALNCVANARILQESGAKEVFVSNAPGDSGQSLGAALFLWNAKYLNKSRRMACAFTGREYTEAEIRAAIEESSLAYRRVDSIEQTTATLLNKGMIIGWFQGKSEFGPRALGARSILADPRNAGVIQRLNEVIKCRESFQPIAPSVIKSRVSEFFDDCDSPFMSFAVKANDNTKKLIPGIVHFDGTSRVQTVEMLEHSYHRLLIEFDRLTGIPIIANTSFNGKGEPIVESPSDAIQAFQHMQLDALAIGDFLVEQ